MSTRRSALLVLTAGALLAGCSEVEPATSTAYQPSKLEAVGDLGLKRVTFTKEGAAQVDVQLATARQVGARTAVPYAALIYDGQGLAWVYSAPTPLTYLRVPVVVDRIDGDQVLLRSGLRSGTRVVTVGAAEVYGAELNIGGGH